MKSLSRITVTVAALTLSATALAGPALADDTRAPGKPAACAQQEGQVDRAEDALERLTAVFERRQDKVAKVKKRAAAADTAQERNRARRDLAEAKADRKEAKTDRTAQQQRLAKATQRLEKCQDAASDEG